MDAETTRLEQGRLKRKTFWRNIFQTPKLLLFLFISFFIYIISIALWGSVLKNTTYEYLILTLVSVNISSVLVFIGVGYANFKIIITFIKSLVRIAFTVWVVLLVQLSSLNQIEQNVWIISCAVFFVYFEVLTDFNSLFHEIDEYQSKFLGFLNSAFLKEYSVPLSLLLTSIINVIISFFIIDLLETIGI